MGCLPGVKLVCRGWGQYGKAAQPVPSAGAYHSALFDASRRIKTRNSDFTAKDAKGAKEKQEKQKLNPKTLKRRGSGGSRGFKGGVAETTLSLKPIKMVGHPHNPKNLCFLRFLCVSRFYGFDFVFGCGLVVLSFPVIL
jgi:hypothetical protein